MPEESSEQVADTQLVPEGCRVVLLSPFEVHFSQTRIRSEFQDGHTLQETIAEIVPAESSGGKKRASLDEVNSNTKSNNEEEEEEEILPADDENDDCILVTIPFPRIEVTRWRCKLREADGTPKLDPVTGLELYSQEERWFTFDNRRLYCLQRAAAALWPRKALCEVVAIPPTLARMRELRKFDTRTFGCSVLVGRRDDPSPELWSCRAAVGLPEEAQPEGGIARQRSRRWRGRGDSRGAGERGNRGRRGVNSREAAEGGRAGMELMRSALLFLLVYLALRIAVSVVRQQYRMGALGGGGPAPSPGPRASS
mmetsp:Transcript_84536/g.196564  ORF Transcript_84536/g.196564 Transcript_84536/m.196564 type:complete len:311 (-) Transcript_84536:92-1024(-)